MSQPPGGNRPSFFILGAPKCGTTSMAAYLGRHPRVFMCEPKEPHYFCMDLPKRRVYPDLDDYLALFAGQADDEIAGEASTWYLYSEAAVPEILSFDGDARFVVMLRNPVEMVQSLHSQFVYDLFESNTDFAAVWRERRDEYYRYCALGEQVERLLATVDADRVHFVLFDDFKRDAEGAYLAVTEFLGLPAAPLDDYPVANKNKRHRSPRLARLIHRTPRPLVALLNTFKRLTGIRKLGLADAVDRKNKEAFRRDVPAADVIRDLERSFANDVGLLGSLIGRDLGHWLRAAP